MLCDFYALFKNSGADEFMILNFQAHRMENLGSGNQVESKLSVYTTVLHIEQIEHFAALSVVFFCFF